MTHDKKFSYGELATGLQTEYKFDMAANLINKAQGGNSTAAFCWGQDIGSRRNRHSSFQRAGDAGGLLFVNGSTATTKQFPLTDRLGNVTGYRRAVTGSPASLDAVYEPTAGRQPTKLPVNQTWQYDAFGREPRPMAGAEIDCQWQPAGRDEREARASQLRSTGPSSHSMAFRFSTKYTDPTGFVYYGYRYYNADRGRWPSRDPIEERGGLNLYGMVGNNAVSHWDRLGLAIDDCCEKDKVTVYVINRSGGRRKQWL